MVVCVRLIIDEGRERKRDKRSVDRLLQSNLDLDGREGTAMMGTKRGRSRRHADTTHTKGRSQPSSLRPPPNGLNRPTQQPKNPKENSRWRSGALRIGNGRRVVRDTELSRRKQTGPIQGGSRDFKIERKSTQANPRTQLDLQWETPIG